MSQIYGYFINKCFYILSFLLASLLKRLFFCTMCLFTQSVCLLFFLKPNEKDAVRTEIKNLREQYPDIRVIVPTYRYPDPESKEFIHELETEYQATILDDSRRFEKSARWKYRIYGSFNYEYLFDAQGQLVKMKPVL